MASQPQNWLKQKKNDVIPKTKQDIKNLPFERQEKTPEIFFEPLNQMKDRTINHAIIFKELILILPHF